MAVSTANAVLRRAITDWRDSFMGVTERQSADSVRSSLLDICIDAGISREALPAPLDAMFIDATDRIRRQGRGGYPQPFDPEVLIRTADDVLDRL